MRADSIRRFLQPAAEARLPFIGPAILALGGFVALLLMSMLGKGEYLWAIFVMVWIAAIASLLAALASAGVRMDKVLPSPQTAFFGLAAFACFFFGIAFFLFAAFDGPMTRGNMLMTAMNASYRATMVADGHVGTLAWRQAREMDALVTQWAKDEEEIRSGSLEGRLHEWKWYRDKLGLSTPMVRGVAEKRLKVYSGSSPAWAVTSRLCEEGIIRFGGSFPFNYNPEAIRTARDYTVLLGREIKPADLLPLVPNGRCE